MGGPASQICICLCSWGVWDQQSESGTEKERERVWVRTKRIWKRDDFVARILSVGSSEMAGVRYYQQAMWHMGALCTVFAANQELVSKKAYFKMMTLLPIPSKAYLSLPGAALAPSSGSQ